MSPCFPSIVVALMGGLMMAAHVTLLVLALNRTTFRFPAVFLLACLNSAIYTPAAGAPMLALVYAVHSLTAMDWARSTLLGCGVMMLISAGLFLAHAKLCPSIVTKETRKLMWGYGAFLFAGVLAIAILVFNEAPSFHSLPLAALMILGWLGVLIALLRRDRSPAPPVAGATPVAARAGAGVTLWAGVDGATWNIWTPLMQQGKAPFMTDLVKRGCSVPLKTILPSHSPILWTTKITGKLPVRHGIRDFIVVRLKGIPAAIEVLPFEPVFRKVVMVAIRLRLATHRLVNPRDRHAKALWNILSEHGLKVGVCGWHVTEPAERIHGWMVPEFFCVLGGKHDTDHAGSPVHPDSLQAAALSLKASARAKLASPEFDAEIRRRFLEGDPVGPREHIGLQVIKAFVAEDTLRADLICLLAKQSPVDAILVFLHGVDVFGHHFWRQYEQQMGPFRNLIPRYYEYTDSLLSKVAKEISGVSRVVVTSDHGQGAAGRLAMIYNTVRGRGELTGSHALGPDGIFAAAGAGIRQGGKPAGMSLFDITPTLLPLFGLPAATDMDGTTQREVLAADVAVPPPVATYEGVSGPLDAEDKTEDSEEVIERLRSLGYLD